LDPPNHARPAVTNSVTAALVRDEAAQMPPRLAPAPRASRRSIWTGRLRQAALPVATAIAVIAAWEAIVRLREIPEVLLPMPSAVAARLVETFPFLVQQA